MLPAGAAGARSRSVVRFGHNPAMTLRLLALIWGFAEATVFFVVPDVLLTAIAVRDLRAGLIACFLALLGALAGGVLMYLWAARDHAAAAALVGQVPAISLDLMARVTQQLREQGSAAAAIVGAFTGVPYKIYAVQAHTAGITPEAFAALSVPARLGRFLLVTLLAGLASRLLAARVTLRWRYGLLVLLWVGFYAAYWSSMPG